MCPKTVRHPSRLRIETVNRLRHDGTGMSTCLCVHALLSADRRRRPGANHQRLAARLERRVQRRRRAPRPTRRSGTSISEAEAGAMASSKSTPASTNNAFQDGNGNLVIRAIKDAQGNYTSARLQTGAPAASTHTTDLSWQYGRIEARIKLPFGKGVWPAFWMLGEDISTTPWPACGEIDIMENFGTYHEQLHRQQRNRAWPGLFRRQWPGSPVHAALRRNRLRRLPRLRHRVVPELHRLVRRRRLLSHRHAGIPARGHEVGFQRSILPSA